MSVFTEEDLKELAWKGLAQLELVALWIGGERGIEYMTSAMARLTGVNRQAIPPGIGPLALIHPDDLDRIREFSQQRGTGEKTPKDIAAFRTFTEDGSVAHVLGSAIPLEYNGHSASVGAIVDVTEQVKALERERQTLRGVIEAMARVVETRDPYTAGHQRRVAALGHAIAERIELSKETAAGTNMAGVIHDLGKLRVPADILTNPGRLTDHEFGIIKTHPQVAYDILKDIDFTWPLADIVHQHHERPDGSGYPQGLAGNDILVEAQILGIADVVEAMASHRPYRPALGLETALEEIAAGTGTRYAREPAEACLELFASGSFSFER